jgi:hypothetical protein
MRKLDTWMTGLLLPATALLLPLAALEAAVCLAEDRVAAGGVAAGACEDGSAHLAMGCASIAL